jgi:putative hydrolase of the HAD superfamily
MCDLDDTLVDRRTMFTQWATRFLRDYALPGEDLEWILEIDDDGHRPREDVFEYLVDRYRLWDDTEFVAEHFFDFYLLKFQVEPEVIDALQRARGADFKVAIVTNGEARSQGAKIDSSGLRDAVDVCCISEDAGFWKPAPEIFEVAAELCDEKLHGSWMIGDNPVADIGGAWRCGAQTIWIRNGRQWPEHLGYRPTLEADTFQEAVDLLLEVADSDDVVVVKVEVPDQDDSSLQPDVDLSPDSEDVGDS